MKFKLQHISSLADTITPVSAYLALRNEFCDVQLLESAEYGKSRNGSSLIGFGSLLSFEVKNHKLKINGDPNESEVVNLPQQLNDFAANIKAEIDFNQCSNAPFLFSFFGYDSIIYFENIQLNNQKQSKLDLPEVNIQLFEFYLQFNHFTNELKLYQYSHSGSTMNLNEVLNLVQRKIISQDLFQVTSDELIGDSSEQFLNSVEEGKKHCQRGDVFQVVLSRKFEQKYKGDEFQVYRQLRFINPSPYMFFLDFGNFKLFGSSPETHIQIQNKKASIHPIAGTIKRKSSEENGFNIEKLLNDPKENAEHDMLIDLARNDLSVFGKNVEVVTKKELQEYSHVFHLVSKVEANISEEENVFAVFGKSFPAGTLSGAPKFRAMEIIDKLETHSRNYYGGAVGYLDLKNNLTTAIMIRTLCATENTLTYMAGAGITVNSISQNELKEVDNKINALRQAIVQAYTLNS